MPRSNTLTHALNACFDHLSIEALYTPQGEDPLTIRVIAKQPDRATAFGETRLHSETAVFEILTSELAYPQAGDILTVKGNSFIIQGVPMRDAKGLIWTIDTARL